MVMPAISAVPGLDNDAASGRDAGSVNALAIPVEHGTHAGRVTPPLDAEDRYVFEIQSEDQFLVHVFGDVTAILLRPGGGTHSTHPTSYYQGDGWLPGEWTLVIQGDGAPADYSFVLRLERLAGHDDAGTGTDAGERRGGSLLLADGSTTGRVDRYDRTDHYLFPVRKNETVTVELTAQGEDALSLWVFDSDATWGSEDALRRTITPPVATWMYAAVHQPWHAEGENAYALSLERSGGEGAGPDALATPHVFAHVDAKGLLGRPDGGVDALLYDRILKVQEGQSEALRSVGSWQSAFARDAEGDHYFRQIQWIDDRWLGTLQEQGARAGMVSLDARDVAFGPDGFLYGATAQGIVRILGDGTIESVVPDVTYQNHIAFAPDGTLYSTSLWHPGLVRIDLASGTATLLREGPLAGLAVDELGRPHFVDLRAGELHRYDPLQERVELVAPWMRDVRDLAFSTDGLYVASHERFSGILHRFELPIEGFLGFEPSFSLPPVGDLAITAFRQEDALTVPVTDWWELYPGVAEQRTFVVEVTNLGAATVEGPVQVALGTSEYSILFQGPRFRATFEGSIAPGETVEFRFAWDTTDEFGGESMRAHVAAPPGEEHDLTNNRASMYTYTIAPVRIGPLV